MRCYRKFSSMYLANYDTSSEINFSCAQDPFYDMWDFGTAHVNPLFIKAWTGGWISSGLIDRMMGLLSKLSFQLKWEISVSGTFFGISSPSEILLNMKKYTFRLSLGENEFLFNTKVLQSWAPKIPCRQDSSKSLKLARIPLAITVMIPGSVVL